MRTLLLFIASGGFVGYIPVASGTFGSLVGIPLFYGFDRVRGLSVLLYLLLFALAVLGACWVAGKTEQALEEHDSHKIVIDEIVGYLAATLFLAPTWQHAVAAFVIFRLFDVIKPYPANVIDRSWSGGAGVVLDDVVSGLYANMATRALMFVVT